MDGHELYPTCFICSLYIAPDYLPIHLRTDHTKEELAKHLLLIYLDEWVEEWQAIAESLER